MDPGNMVDSRALCRNTPTSLHKMQKFVYKPLLPLLRFVNPTLRTAAPAAIDVIELALNPIYTGLRGYFIGLKKAESSPESNDKAKQKLVWNRTQNRSAERVRLMHISLTCMLNRGKSVFFWSDVP